MPIVKMDSTQFANHPSRPYCLAVASTKSQNGAVGIGSRHTSVQDHGTDNGDYFPTIG